MVRGFSRAVAPVVFTPTISERRRPALFFPRPTSPACKKPPPPQQSEASSPLANRGTIPDSPRSSSPLGPHPCTENHRRMAPVRPSPPAEKPEGKYAIREPRFFPSPCPMQSPLASFLRSPEAF